jgi:hypothetical protein
MMKKPSKVTVPEKILLEAIKQVTTKSKVHGATRPSFDMIAEFWGVYVRHRDNIIEPHDVAQMMVLLKIARSVYGDNTDNFVDEAGYSAIGAMLNTVEGDEE